MRPDEISSKNNLSMTSYVQDSWFSMDSSRDNLKIIIMLHLGIETTTSAEYLLIQISKFSMGKVRSNTQS